MSAEPMEILEKVLDGARLSSKSALLLLREADFHDLMDCSHEIRMKKHPEPVVTYIIDRNINYTNICTSGCKFCAFYKEPGDAGGFVLTRDDLFKKLEELVASGGRQVLLQGGLHPDFGIEYYEELLDNIKRHFDIHIHGFSPPEIVHIAQKSRMSFESVILQLREAGLDTIPGGGAEILANKTRSELSPNKCTADEWCEVMRIAHENGIRTTATMMFGHIETDEERIVHLERIRELQDDTGGFTAFISWTFQPGNSRLDMRAAGGIEYLRMLAISRLFLDNIDNFQTSWVTQGAKIAEISLLCGANDLGSTMMEENVVKAAGTWYNMSENELITIAENAGFKAARRDTYYRLVENCTT